VKGTRQNANKTLIFRNLRVGTQLIASLQTIKHGYNQ